MIRRDERSDNLPLRTRLATQEREPTDKARYDRPAQHAGRFQRGASDHNCAISRSQMAQTKDFHNTIANREALLVIVVAPTFYPNAG